MGGSRVPKSPGSHFEVGGRAEPTPVTSISWRAETRNPSFGPWDCGTLLPAGTGGCHRLPCSISWTGWSQRHLPVCPGATSRQLCSQRDQSTSSPIDHRHVSPPGLAGDKLTSLLFAEWCCRDTRGWRPTLGQPRGATSLAARSAERQAWGAQAMGPQRWVQEGASGRAVTQGCPPLLADDEKQGTMGTLAECACGGLPSSMAGSWGRGSPTPHKPRALRSSPTAARSREGPGGYFLLCPDCIAQPVPLVCSGLKLAWQDPMQAGGFLSWHQNVQCPGGPSACGGSVAVSPADLEVLGSPCSCQPLHAGISNVFEHAAATKTFRGEEAEQVDRNWRNSYLPGVLQAGSIFFVILENFPKSGTEGQVQCWERHKSVQGPGTACAMQSSPARWHTGSAQLLPRAELHACRILASW